MNSQESWEESSESWKAAKEIAKQYGITESSQIRLIELGFLKGENTAIKEELSHHREMDRLDRTDEDDEDKDDPDDENPETDIPPIFEQALREASND